MRKMKYEKRILKAIGKNIKVLRTEKGLSQEELAERSGLHSTYISQLEGGKRNVTILVLLRICEALGVEVSELL